MPAPSMSSDEEMESFEITNEDLFKPRRKRRFTKQDAMLGIWAERDSDEEERERGCVIYIYRI